MKDLRVKVLGAGLAGLALVFAGCSLLGPRGADRVEADALEQEIADYQTWQTPSWVAGYQESAHPVPTYVRYYVNDIGMSDIDNPPAGSIFVKEQFDEDHNFLNLTVMKRIEGYNPEAGDWYWAIADTDGQVTNGGRLDDRWTSNCISCHSRGDGGGDLLFVND